MRGASRCSLARCQQSLMAAIAVVAAAADVVVTALCGTDDLTDR
jgi:hypothetical protein